MAKPAQPSQTEQGEHARYSRLCQNILVWETVLPGDAQNASKAGGRCRVWLLAGVEGPGLATVEQRAEHAGLVHLYLGADGQHGVVPDPVSKTYQYCCCIKESTPRNQFYEKRKFFIDIKKHTILSVHEGQ